MNTVVCGSCDGDGVVDGTHHREKCEYCEGSGEQEVWQVRWSYTSRSEPTFGRNFASLEQALNEVSDARKDGMLYVDLILPDGSTYKKWVK